MRERKIENYLDKAFILASNKPKKLEDIHQKDWKILNFNIDSRFDEYFRIMKKELMLWSESDWKSDLIDEWIEIQSKALFSNKELIQNVLVDIAVYNILNQGMINIIGPRLANSYCKQLESGEFSEKEIANELRKYPKLKRTNKEIIQCSIQNSNLI